MNTSTTTVLFTDLVASTELSVQFGARFDEARRAHDALLRSAVEANHGRVIKGTGDGLMGTFDTATDGIAAARSAQQSIHRLNRQGREPALSIRVGLVGGRRDLRGNRLLRPAGDRGSPPVRRRCRATRSSPPSWCARWRGSVERAGSIPWAPSS